MNQGIHPGTKGHHPGRLGAIVFVFTEAQRKEANRQSSNSYIDGMGDTKLSKA